MSKSKTVSEQDLKKIKSPIFLIENKHGLCVLPKLPNKEYLNKIPNEKLPPMYGKTKKPLYVYKVNKTNFDKMLKSCAGNISGTLRMSVDGDISIVPNPLIFNSRIGNNNKKSRNNSRTSTSSNGKKYKYANGNFKYERTHIDPKIKCIKGSKFKTKKTCKDKIYWCPSIENPYGCHGEWRCSRKNQVVNNCMNIDYINSFYASN